MGNSRAEEHRQAYVRQAARRRFLIKTLGLGAVGLAAGGAAAWTKTELDGAATAGSSLAQLRLQLDSALAAKKSLESSYTALQGQAGQWQTQLTAANTQNAQLASSLQSTQQEAADLRTQLASLQAAFDNTSARLARTNELVGLYDQLEAAGLDGVVQNGLASFAGVLAGLVGPSHLLRGGVESARGLLSGFEAVLPDFRGAMAWLGDNVVKLKVGLWSVENSAQETVNSAAAGIAAAFAGFAGFIIDHLPFNIGDRVRATLSATLSVLANATSLADSAGDQVLLKISKHVDDGPQSWNKTLVAPLRDNTLAAADQVLTALNDTGGAYKASLETPAASAIEKRRVVREAIAAHRAAHGI